jgi:WD40 repeat protein
MHLIQVHRCRFISSVPSPIQCIALTHSSRQNLLVVCRENSQIECWEYLHNRFHCIKTIAEVGRYVRQMCFVPSLRTLDDPDEFELLTCGLDGTLRLWSVLTEVRLGEWILGGGAQWDMSTYRVWDRETQQMVTYVAVACDDGAVRLYALVATDLRLVAVLRTPHTHRLLSVTFGHSRYAHAQNNHFTVPFAQPHPYTSVQLWACSQRGHVYGWRVPLTPAAISSHSQVRTTPNVHFQLPRLRKERPFGWAVRSYYAASKFSIEDRNEEVDDRLLVADSSGRLTVWDTRTATLLATLLPPLPTGASHPSHVTGPDLLTLCLQITSTSLVVYTAGVDPQIVQWTWEASRDTWHYTRKWRPHSHDIRVLQLLCHASRDAPDCSKDNMNDDRGLLSAGVDSTLCLSRLDTDPPTVHRILPFSHHPSHIYHIVHFASSAAIRYNVLLAVQQQRCIEFWGFHRRVPSSSTSELMSPSLLLKLTPNFSASLKASALSHDGRHLACVSNANELRVYTLLWKKADGSSHEGTAPVRVDKSQLVSTIFSSPDMSSTEKRNTHTHVTHLAFVPYSTLLAIVLSNGVVTLYDVAQAQSLWNVDHFAHRSLRKPLPCGTLHTLTFSDDGKWLATVDLHHIVNVFSVHPSAVSHHVTLPSFSTPLTAVAIHTFTHPTVLLADLSNTLWLYDIETCKLSTVDDALGPTDHNLSKSHWKAELPPNDCIVGFTFNPSHSSSLLAHGSTFLLYLDLTPSLSSTRARVILRYQPLLLAAFVASDTLLVLEQPWDKVLPLLPPPFERPHFGT